MKHIKSKEKLEKDLTEYESMETLQEFEREESRIKDFSSVDLALNKTLESL